MKIEFTRAEVERLILAHANLLVNTDEGFNHLDVGYRTMPDVFTVSTVEVEDDAAQ